MVVASAFFFTAICCGEDVPAAYWDGADKHFKKASSVVRSELETAQQAAEKRMLSKLKVINCTTFS